MCKFLQTELDTHFKLLFLTTPFSSSSGCENYIDIIMLADIWRQYSQTNSGLH